MAAVVVLSSSNHLVLRHIIQTVWVSTGVSNRLKKSERYNGASITVLSAHGEKVPSFVSDKKEEKSRFEVSCSGCQLTFLWLC